MTGSKSKNGIKNITHSKAALWSKLAQHLAGTVHGVSRIFPSRNRPIFHRLFFLTRYAMQTIFVRTKECALFELFRKWFTKTGGVKNDGCKKYTENLEGYSAGAVIEGSKLVGMSKVIMVTLKDKSYAHSMLKFLTTQSLVTTSTLRVPLPK